MRGSARRYRDDTLILETDFETPDGAVTLIDFMPQREDCHDLVRIVTGRRGQLAMRFELVLRFDYGATVPWVTRADDGTLEAIAGPGMALLRTPIELRGEEFKTVGDFTVSEGADRPVRAFIWPLLPAAARTNRPHRRTERYGGVLAQLVGGLHWNGRMGWACAAFAHHAQGADISARPAASSRLLPRRCPSSSAEAAIGTTGIAGSAMLRSRC